MLVRKLSRSDNIEFLVKAYLTELEKLGSEIPATKESITAVCDVARNGVCFVAGSPAIAWTAAYQLETPFPTLWRKVAMSLGTYVDPSHRRSGVASALRTALQDELVDQGFDTLLGGVHINNKTSLVSLDQTSAGFTPHQVIGYRRLK
jgi:GNAT superfamily N-acetyltransferase